LRSPSCLGANLQKWTAKEASAAAMPLQGSSNLPARQ
jgi:hypothetical protein